MKIAVIGSGISGISSALIASYNNLDVTLFEKNNYLGGHTRTIKVNYNHNEIFVDTGFIVFNEKTYPNLLNFFKYLNVEKEKSDMSFSCRIEKENKVLEYGCRNLSAIFANKKNLVDIKFLKCLWDIKKFFRSCEKPLEKNPNISLENLINSMNLGSYFKDYFITPIASAIWSSRAEKILDYPAATFVNFFKNHGLLSFTNQPQWFFVKGGSFNYIKKFEKVFKGTINLNSKVEKIETKNNKVYINSQEFDAVIMACHSDQAYNLLKNKAEVLKDISYQKNTITVHKDISFMPKNKKCWSSWNYLIKQNSHYLTYYMNELQNIDKNFPIFVSLNVPKGVIKNQDVFDEYEFEHPHYNELSVNAQKKVSGIQGVDNIYYTGAYLGYGFHEDGISSAINATKKMNLKLPW